MKIGRFGFNSESLIITRNYRCTNNTKSAIHLSANEATLIPSEYIVLFWLFGDCLCIGNVGCTYERFRIESENPIFIELHYILVFIKYLLFLNFYLF